MVEAGNGRRPGLGERLKDFLERNRTSAAAGGLVALGAALLLWRSARPSNRRRWVRGQERLARAERGGDRVLIRNIRCFSWLTEGSAEERYEERSYDLSALRTLDFIISRFGMRGLAAHTMLSFGFADGAYLVVSVEIRRREGQHYSIVHGLLRSFELQYILADERDVVRLRTNVRREPTYLYPVAVPVDRIRRLLVSVLERANRIAERPEFYHSVANACTTNLIRHFNEAGLCRASERGPRAVLSGLSDGLLRDLGLIGDGERLHELRRRHLINAKAQACGDGPGFSRAIRT